MKTTYFLQNELKVNTIVVSGLRDNILSLFYSLSYLKSSKDINSSLLDLNDMLTNYCSRLCNIKRICKILDSRGTNENI